MMRYAVALLLLWLCRQAMTGTSSHTSSKYNETKASLGQTFFHDLIHDDESYKNVNEQNLCSLIHFFIREANHNGRSVQFSSGMFVLYDSTQRFFRQLMMAKDAQHHSNDHRSGFIRRLRYFALDCAQSTLRILSTRGQSSAQLPFIYLRGDESSHFRERGSLHERWHLYPAYGVDVPQGCMPNRFSHILFGQLKGLSDNVTFAGDRIYIKPEPYGLQQFRHYLAHTGHYIKAISHLFLCRFTDRCMSGEVFHEWTDRKLVRKWSQVLSTIDGLAPRERRKMQDQAASQGVLEMYRQARLFPALVQVNEFRRELERRYGHDARSRKGDEIIFTTEQLLSSSPFSGTNVQCDAIAPH